MAQSATLRAWLLWHMAPLLLTCLLLLWLAGGFPPANWQLLTLLLVNPASYKALPGASLQTSLVILSVQALLLLVVWVCLLVQVWRAVLALLKEPEQKVANRTSAALQAMRNMVPGTARRATSASNPFENLAHQRLQNGTMTLGKTGVLNKNFLPQAERDRRQTGSSIASSVGMPQGSTPSVPPTQVPGGSSDPFAVQADLLELFAQPEAPVAQTPAQSVRGQPEQAAQAEFVFGNPFEGPLPEVFEYDTDLKQSLAHLKAERGPTST